MGFKMHDYKDGTIGLAAFCDVCREQVTENDGYILWNSYNPDNWLLIHKMRCDPTLLHAAEKYIYNMSMPLGVEIVYLVNSMGLDFDQERRTEEIYTRIEP